MFANKHSHNKTIVNVHNNAYIVLLFFYVIFVQCKMIRYIFLSACMVISNSPLVVFNAEIQNLLRHGISWVIKFDSECQSRTDCHKYHSSYSYFILLCMSKKMLMYFM